MQNPFESGQIKNYILFYASVVVIMVLFFIASTLFLDQERIEQKKFDYEKHDQIAEKKEEVNIEKKAHQKKKFKLLKSAY